MARKYRPRPQNMDERERGLELLANAAEYYEAANKALDMTVGYEARQTSNASAVARWAKTVMHMQHDRPDIPVIDQRDTAIRIAAAAIQRLAATQPQWKGEECPQ